MKYSVVLPVNLGVLGEPSDVLRVARHAEELGFESVSAVEHAVVISDTESRYPYAPDGRLPLPNDLPYPDPLELLAYLAAGTDRLGLSTGVLVLPNHNPFVLAKRLATLDRLSGGRLRICAGLGWMREEIEACGGDFARRGKVADESIRLMRELWASTSPEGLSFQGEFYAVEGAHSYPKPHAGRAVPLHIGGHSEAAARRAGRLGDGFQPLGLAGDELTAALTLVRETAREAGRDPGDVELTLGATLPRAADRTEWAESLGADRLVLSGSRHATSLDAFLDELTACAVKVGLSR
ncbi:LLM class F420-dependent oxidoreductase [Streptomyces endophyticus]|uniref:LLM class F420-dependent oxidoreductase n=1 Tax=Streptomyces endophyticus TaxID=714166 RepID=A0ABU6FDK3_9ACTN|nr:LLM class F420-dependent oxidoreductase [Streptomyces endophyticus]MEB8341914.1 LLM class F420-dependent oxidoreductase [Streptomyces endophyticus]